MMTNGDFYSDLMVINVDLMMIFFYIDVVVI